MRANQEIDNIIRILIIPNIGLFTFLILIGTSSLYCQSSPYLTSDQQDSLYDKINSYNSLFCHDPKQRLISYEDSLNLILFNEGSPLSVESKKRDWRFNFQNKTLIILDEIGEEYQLLRNGQDILIQSSDTIFSLLNNSKNITSYGLTPDKNNNYSVFSTRINNFRVSITCDTSYTRIFKVNIHFSHKASLFLKLSSYDIDFRPYSFISYSSHNMNVLDTFFDLYGHLDFMLVHHLATGDGFKFSSKRKKMNPRITWLYYFPEMTEFPDGELHWPYYPMYTYRKSGRMKKQLIEINNCY